MDYSPTSKKAKAAWNFRENLSERRRIVLDDANVTWYRVCRR